MFEYLGMGYPKHNLTEGKSSYSIMLYEGIKLLYVLTLLILALRDTEIHDVLIGKFFLKINEKKIKKSSKNLMQ